MPPGYAERMTPEEFLRFEAKQEETWELVDGRPRRKPDPGAGMAGGAHAYHRIAENLTFGLRPRLQRGPCFAMREQKVLIPGGNQRYPDVTVDCGPEQRMQDRAAERPTVVFEVECPGGSQIDALERFEDFQSVPSIAQIVFLSQTEHKARVYARTEAGWRGETISGPKAVLVLAALGCALPLSEINEGVAFAP